MTEPAEPRAPRSTSRGTRRELGLAAAALVVGGGAALFAAARAWTTLTLHRAAPLASVVVPVTGRTLRPAVTALAVVALAGVVALLATRGWARRGLGGLLALTGAALVWSAALGFAPISSPRARALIVEHRPGVTINPTDSVHIATASLWPAVSLLGGVLVLGGGVLAAVRGAAWSALSSRYDSPSGEASTSETSSQSAPSDPTGEQAETARARADLALWQSLERGEDPTA